MNKYECQHCGENAIIPLETDIDSGTTLTCNHCGQETVFDLFTPQKRAELYINALGLHVIKIEQPNPDETCFHQHPMGPPGRTISQHPKSEPCELRDAAEAQEKGQCFNFREDLLLCITHNCAPDRQCAKKECPHCADKLTPEDESGASGC